MSRVTRLDSIFENGSIFAPGYTWTWLRSILLSVIFLILSTLIFSTNARADCIDATAHELHIDGDLLRAIAWRESHFSPDAQHLNRNGSIDIGLMQVNSIHLSELRQIGVSRSMLSNSCTNVRAAGWLLAQIFRNYGSTWRAIGEYHSHTPGLSNQYAKQIHEIYLARSWSRRTATLNGSESSWRGGPFAQTQSIQQMRSQRTIQKLGGVQVINVSYEENNGDVSSRRSKRRHIPSLYASHVNHSTHIWRHTPKLAANKARITNPNEYDLMGRMYSKRSNTSGKATYIANVRVRPAWVPYIECSISLGHPRALDEIAPQSALAWMGGERDLVAGVGKMVNRCSAAMVESINAKGTPHRYTVIGTGDKNNLTMRKAPSSPFMSTGLTGGIYRELFTDNSSADEIQSTSGLFLNDIKRNWKQVLGRRDLTNATSRQSVKLAEIPGKVNPATVEQFRNENTVSNAREYICQSDGSERDDTRKDRSISTDNSGIRPGKLEPSMLNCRLGMSIKTRGCLWKPSAGAPSRIETSNARFGVIAPMPHSLPDFNELNSIIRTGSGYADEYPCPAEIKNLLARDAAKTRFYFSKNFHRSRKKLIAFQHGPPQCGTA
ncbi:lytic transglycosylase domain-containing protein [Burkholderia pyrrocinia]